MDYDKLIERLYQHNKDYGEGRTQDFFRVCLDCKDAATAIEAIRADLARVTAERDAAIADIAAILAEVEEIRRGYGVDNADADAAFADLCGNYCAKCGNNCYEEAEDYRCKNFKWRGIKEG